MNYPTAAELRGKITDVIYSYSPPSLLNLYEVLKLIYEKSKKTFLTFPKANGTKFIF